MIPSAAAVRKSKTRDESQNLVTMLLESAQYPVCVKSSTNDLGDRVAAGSCTPASLPMAILAVDSIRYPFV